MMNARMNDTPNLDFYNGDYLNNPSVINHELRDKYEQDKKNLHKVYKDLIELLEQGNQHESISKKFKELLQYGNKLFTLVLVVGSKELYSTVDAKIQSDFCASHQRINPPIVLHFQVVHASLCKDTEWVSKQNVDEDIKCYLKAGMSFVFYRDGVFSNVFISDKYEEAVTEIVTLFRDPLPVKQPNYQSTNNQSGEDQRPCNCV